MFKKVIFILSFLISQNVLGIERDENEIVWADEKDPVMVEAIKEARATLDTFLRKYKSNIPNVTSYKLKVMLTDENGTEHFWVTPFRPAKSGGFEGVLANEPRIVRNVKQGEMIQFTRSIVSDWGYVENGKQFGSFTVCALFRTMPKEQVTYYKKNHGFQCK